jgi:uncharacterized SAM-binding protein YcdF (DUF218 family)
VRGVVGLIVSDGGLIVFVTILGLWIAARPTSRLARRAIIIVALVYGCASVYGVSYLFERLLVRGYRPVSAADVAPKPTAIVILGSGSFTARDWDRGEYSIVDRDAAERVREAARLFALIDPNWVITSGGPVVDRDPNIPTAIAIRNALIEIGLPVSRVRAVTGARNTFEEAVRLNPFLHELGVEQVVLVTSQAHMRRSVGAFRAVGISVVPAIARNSFLDRSWRDWWLPSGHGLDEAAAVAHEYVGIAVYAAQRRYQF